MYATAVVRVVVDCYVVEHCCVMAVMAIICYVVDDCCDVCHGSCLCCRLLCCRSLLCDGYHGNDLRCVCYVVDHYYVMVVMAMICAVFPILSTITA